jgi:hypothetical protein
MLEKNKITRNRFFIMCMTVLLLFCLSTPVMAQGGGERERPEPSFLMPLIQYHRNSESGDISSADRSRRAPGGLASRPSPEQANRIEENFVRVMQNGVDSASAHEAVRKLMEFAGINNREAMLEIAGLYANSTETIDKVTPGLAIFVAESIIAFAYSNNADNH